MRALTSTALTMVTIAAAALAASSAALAQTYPSKPVRVIVPFPPGAGVDIVTRIVTPRLSEQMGQQFVADNRAGAGGIVGAEVAAKAPADGYNLLMGTAGLLTVVPVMSKVSYNVARDFMPITLVASVPSLLVVHPTLPVKTMKELVALARAKPGAINYASTGSGTLPHLTAELFRLQTGVNIVHIPYKGSAPAMTDLLGGHVEMFFGNMLSVIPQVRENKLRALVITTKQRSPAAPNIPTVAEAGYPGLEAETWFGLLAPAGTPKEAIAKVHDELIKALRHPDTQRMLADQGAIPIGNTPEQFAAYIQAETRKWEKVLKASGVRAE
ncbi:MAG: Bug family tripartite tricarboxylate transporter substrate binding protein [Burkholderiales bacterium]